MYNCIKVYRNNRLFAIMGNKSRAETMSFRVDPRQSDTWRFEEAFIEGIGF
jgi:hypothetical protein